MKNKLKWSRSFLSSLVWLTFYVTLTDAAINFLFEYPDDQNQKPSRLEDYFNYGLSTEAKLEKLTAHSLEQSAPTVGSGWMEGQQYDGLPNRPIEPSQVLVALYGMSHTKLLGEALGGISSRYVTRIVTAPGAVPSWAHAAYLHDRKRVRPDIVIMGIMTEGVALASTTSGMTAYPDSAYPYTYPRFYLDGNDIKIVETPFQTSEDYRSAFFDQKEWKEFRGWLDANDLYYDSITFRHNLTDYSAFFRLIRRAYTQYRWNLHGGEIYSPQKGFNRKSYEARLVQQIVVDFAKKAEREGAVPILYLVNTQGNGAHLFNLLNPVLEGEGIPYLSTHQICPPNDPRVFLPANSHFIPSKDTELAKAMADIIEKQFGPKLSDS